MVQSSKFNCSWEGSKINLEEAKVVKEGERKKDKSTVESANKSSIAPQPLCRMVVVSLMMTMKRQQTWLMSPMSSTSRLWRLPLLLFYVSYLLMLSSLGIVLLCDFSFFLILATYWIITKGEAMKGKGRQLTAQLFWKKNYM